jgi:chemotaxis protein CheX
LAKKRPAALQNYVVRPMKGHYSSMIAEKNQITDQIVEDCVVRSVQSVFRTMMGHDAVLTRLPEGVTPTISNSSTQVIGGVGFLGAANGMIYLCFGEDFAKHASSQMLGMSPAEVEMSGNEVVHDVIGEITNMTVGGFKNAIADLGFPCKLTLPSIVRGHKLSIASIKAASRHVFRFEIGGHVLLADLQLKLE